MFTFTVALLTLKKQIPIGERCIVINTTMWAHASYAATGVGRWEWEKYCG